MQTVRSYQASDREACLAIFDGNTPRFFDASERAGCAAWLEESKQPYLLIERDGRRLSLRLRFRATETERRAG
ncbi:hypothetical protein [Janthinobacterium sp. ROICE36]|uniref:hypothetical protein n=1 Tax=Janthinobacterium sp. ROICE36 TaxID=2048670 RepID=UPI0015E12C04|nr:hypothetical protein [Janthinobacterium sp. ROICE36]